MRMREVYVESNLKFKGQLRPSQQIGCWTEKRGQAESQRGNARGIVALLNRLNVGSAFRAADRAWHATHSRSAS